MVIGGEVSIIGGIEVELVLDNIVAGLDVARVEVKIFSSIVVVVLFIEKIVVGILLFKKSKFKGINGGGPGGGGNKINGIKRGFTPFFIVFMIFKENIYTFSFLTT